MCGRNRRALVKGVLAVAMATSAVAVIAQRGTEAPGGASLADVAGELRQLRLAVEESTRRQTEAHALGVYLSAQQSRLVQLTSRLDVARRELDRVTRRSNELSTALTANEEELRSAKPEQRPVLEMQARAVKEQLEHIPAELRQAQIREAELSQMQQVEEARWADLITKLEQLIKR